MNELNEKLAKWAGLRLEDIPDYGLFWCDSEGFAVFKDGEDYFTHSTDAFFEWIAPLLFRWAITNMGMDTKVITATVEMELKDGLIHQSLAQAETPALALCNAWEKLIDEEAEDE